MPNLRKRKSKQLTSSGLSGKKTNHGANKKSLGKQGDVREGKQYSCASGYAIITRSIYRQNKMANSNTAPKADSPESAVCVHSTNITVLSDEVLLQIFSHLTTRTIVKFVGRTCKKWNRLSKDKVLWRVVHIGFAYLNPVTAKRIFRRYCEPGRLKVFYMGVESHRFENDEPDSSDRDWHWETKCLTPGTLKKLKEVGSGLERFGIVGEQICQIDLFSSLPSNQLTHLSLAYCNLSLNQFYQLLLPDSHCLLKELLVLDLTGVEVHNFRQYKISLEYDYGDQLPPKVHTLILRDSEFSLYNKSFQSLILCQGDSLLDLDLSIMCISDDFLRQIGRENDNLQYLNLSGSVLATAGQDTFNNKQGDELRDSMHREWRFNASTFLMLKSANLRNLTHVGGGLMDNPEWYQLMASHIDVHGKKVYRYEGEDDLPPPELLIEIKRKWKEWKPSELETTKYTYKARQELDKLRHIREHPDWPDNTWPGHPDYETYKSTQPLYHKSQH